MSNNGNSTSTPPSVITIATWALALCLGVIVVTLSIIVIRDGNTPLVSQAMGELLWLGGIAIATLVGLLGFTKYLEATPSTPSNASSVPSAASPAVPAVAASVGAGVADVASIVQTILSQQSQASGAVSGASVIS